MPKNFKEENKNLDGLEILFEGKKDYIFKTLEAGPKYLYNCGLSGGSSLITFKVIAFVTAAVIA